MEIQNCHNWVWYLNTYFQSIRKWSKLYFVSEVKGTNLMGRIHFFFFCAVDTEVLFPAFWFFKLFSLLDILLSINQIDGGKHERSSWWVWAFYFGSVITRLRKFYFATKYFLIYILSSCFCKWRVNLISFVFSFKLLVLDSQNTVYFDHWWEVTKDDGLGHYFICAVILGFRKLYFATKYFLIHIFSSCFHLYTVK